MSAVPAGACPRCGSASKADDRFCGRCGSALGLPPAGWYADPAGPGRLRWWDGRQWSEQVAVPNVAVPNVAVHTPWADPAVGRSERPSEPRQRLPGLGAAVVGLVLGAGLGALLVFVLDAAGRPGGTAVTLTVSELGLWSGLVGAPVFVSRRWGTGRLSEDFGWTFRPVDLAIGLVGALAGHAAGVVAILPLYAAFHDLLTHPQVGLPQDQIQGAVWPVYGVIVIVGAPIVEELFFRGLVQTRLVGRYGPGWGITVTSIVFGCAHLIGWQGPGSLLAATAIAASGGVLGFLRHRTGRLGTSTAAHSMFNAMAFALLAAGV